MKQRFSKRTRLVSALLTLAMVFTFLPFSAFAANTEIDFNSPDFKLKLILIRRILSLISRMRNFGAFSKNAVTKTAMASSMWISRI